jgi:hypothetical protein
MRLPPVLKFSKGVKYLPVLDPSLQGTGRSEKKRTPGLIFGSPAAGTPVRRGDELDRRPATAGPPGATPKPICACFMRRGCRWGGGARERSPEAPISVASWESWVTFAIRSAEMLNEVQEVSPRAPTACGRIILKCCLRLGRAIQASEETTSTGTLPTKVARNPARRKA